MKNIHNSYSAHKNDSTPRRCPIFVAIMLLLGISSILSCGPFVAIERVDPAVASTVKVYIEARDLASFRQDLLDIYLKDPNIIILGGIAGKGLKGHNVKILKSIDATSCQNKMWDEPASMSNCIDQMRMKVARMGGNGLLVGDSVSLEAFSSHIQSSGVMGTGVNRNCWTTVDCRGLALLVK